MKNSNTLLKHRTLIYLNNKFNIHEKLRKSRIKNKFWTTYDLPILYCADWLPVVGEITSYMDSYQSCAGKVQLSRRGRKSERMSSSLGGFAYDQQESSDQGSIRYPITSETESLKDQEDQSPKCKKFCKDPNMERHNHVETAWSTVLNTISKWIR